MKKLVITLLAVVLLIPTTAGAVLYGESYYAYYTPYDGSSVTKSVGNVDTILNVLTFQKNGTLSGVVYTIIDGTPTAKIITGTWEKARNLKYHYKIDGIGEGFFYYRSEGLYFPFGDTNLCIIYKRLKKNELAEVPINN